MKVNIDKGRQSFNWISHNSRAHLHNAIYWVHKQTMAAKNFLNTTFTHRVKQLLDLSIYQNAQKFSITGSAQREGIFYRFVVLCNYLISILGYMCQLLLSERSYIFFVYPNFNFCSCKGQSRS